MTRVIFDTIEDYNAQQKLDFALWMESHPGSEYAATTKRYSKPEQRKDGKYECKALPSQSYGGRSKAPFNKGNFPTVEGS